MNLATKRRDGFDGEKLISIPEKVWKDTLARDPALFKLYISHIGYFPKASYHYRERRKGCEDNILLYCLHGKGYCILNDKKIVLEANQFIIIPATDKYLRYWADKSDPWTLYWVHYTGPDIKSLNKSLNINLQDGPVYSSFNEKAIGIWEEIFKSLEMGYSKENLANACFCLYYLLATFIYPERHKTSQRDEPQDMISKTVHFMRANLDKKLSIDEISALNGLSASHFSGLFRKSTGMPPIDYFIHLKMQKACGLLNFDQAKIKVVATELGYEDQYYFSRLFKKCMGISPQQYKLTLRNGTHGIQDNQLV
ncbi:MAG: transcriptional regulator, AraC family [Mucilaginibacter sp.]|nr:transcriptional regulator, AraC family [Mucilaginibacter sp.]